MFSKSTFHILFDIGWSGLRWFVSFVGGFGGILYLVQLLYSRPRLVIRQFRETFHPRASDQIRFEAENMGEKTTSLAPVVTLTAFNLKAEPVDDVANVTSPSRDRSLSPRQPKTFEAHFSQNDQKVHAFWLLKKYTFRLSHRAKFNIYMRHSSGKPINFFRYQVEVMLCKLLGQKWLEHIANL